MEASRKSIWGWALYDWANSVFATTVIAGFFLSFLSNFGVLEQMSVSVQLSLVLRILYLAY
jgi:MFS-type transporter involved in bile tolerance (Atg22 family)